MLKRRERPSALLSVGGRFLRIWGGAGGCSAFLGVPLPVPFKSELF